MDLGTVIDTSFNLLTITCFTAGSIRAMAYWRACLHDGGSSCHTSTGMGTSNQRAETAVLRADLRAGVNDLSRQVLTSAAAASLCSVSHKPHSPDSVSHRPPNFWLVPPAYTC
jgi:hypothetical protein